MNVCTGAFKEAFTFAAYTNYASTDCTGPAILDLNIPPRFVFVITNDLSGAYRTIPVSGVPGAGMTFQSTRQAGGGCSAQTGTAFFSGVAYQDTAPATPIVKPASLFQPPLHPEFIN